MAQAMRYKHFANVAILVVPTTMAAAALPYLETFRRIRVGLWLFNERTGRISSSYTPRPSMPKEMKYYRKALTVVSQVSKGQVSFERS
jgi:hypothetical protein